MNFKISLVNIFLSPLAVGIARGRARARKHKDFFYRDIAIYCSEERVPMLKEAVDEVASFYGDDWPRYRKNLKRIILDDALQSILWIPRKTTIIQESDERRMGSPVRLAGGLIADYERIQAYREKHSLHIIWNTDLPAEARARAEAKCKQFLSGLS